MKELQIDKEIFQSTEQKLTSPKPGKIRKRILCVRSRSPAASASETPILCVLAKSPGHSMRARDVLREVARWFPELTEEDKTARYPGSKKKIVPSVIKWSKKNLVLRGEIFPPRVASEVGAWELTEKGLQRAKEGAGVWRATYSVHDAILIQKVEDRS
jgi:hypothetical protein